jgi:predicted nucleotidyltransferase
MTLNSSNIQSIQKYFLTQPVLKAYLFGSYARNEADQNSDIDVLVDLDYSSSIGLEFVQMQLDLQELFSQKVDLVSSRGLSEFIKPIIEREKKLIYER